MAMTGPLIEEGVQDLHLICVPTGGMQIDLLVGAGVVSSVETSAVTLGEAGGAPRFNQAVKDGTIELRDATCPAVHAGLLAAQRGLPFMPMRGLIGTDILKYRKDWRVIDNPFSDGSDRIVLVPAIKPDVSIFHAPKADKFGNVWIGRRRELALMAYASHQTLVTVEKIVEEDLLESECSAAGTLPALYVSAVALAPNGAWPYGLWGEYSTDTAEILKYAKSAKSIEGFAEYMKSRHLETA
jgi:glutaconate CoA-transferase, subunit A